MRLRIVGVDLPGRSFLSQGVQLGNVHVGIQERQDVVHLVAGDAPRAVWECDIQVVRADTGDIDFRGPHVQGKRGERFVYLSWGDVRPDGSFVRFGRTKLMLDRVDTNLIDAAGEDRALVATVRLTNERGAPRLARLDPPAIEWSVSTARTGG